MASAQQKADMKEAFSLFDKDADGKIGSKQLGNVMRALGLSPTESEIATLVAQVDAKSKGVLTFDAFVALVGPKMKDAMTEQQVIEAFGAFDKEGNGLIPSHELRHYMANIGEKLNEEELEDLKREMSSKEAEGNVNYPDLVRYMMQAIQQK